MEILALEIDRARFLPEVVCFDGLGPSCESLTAAGIPVRLLRRRGRILDLHLVTRLSALFRETAETVVHAHGTSSLIYAGLAGALARRPVIATEHGRRFIADKAHDRVLARVATSLLHRHVAVSGALRGEIHTSRRCGDVVVVPNGVRAPDPMDRCVLRRQLGIPADSFVAGCVARFVPVKNHRLLLEAWQLIARKVPHAVLLLIGDGPGRRAIETAASKDGVSSIRFLGERADARRLMMVFDLNILPSTFEAMSMTLLEASSCGVPSVATAVGGNPEIILDGETGVLVPCDATALAGAVISLACDPARRSILGQRARQRLRAEFSVEVMVRRYERLYVQCSRSVLFGAARCPPVPAMRSCAGFPSGTTEP